MNSLNSSQMKITRIPTNTINYALELQEWKKWIVNFPKETSGIKEKVSSFPFMDRPMFSQYAKNCSLEIDLAPYLPTFP